MEFRIIHSMPTNGKSKEDLPLFEPEPAKLPLLSNQLFNYRSIFGGMNLPIPRKLSNILLSFEDKDLKSRGNKRPTYLFAIRQGLLINQRAETGSLKERRGKKGIFPPFIFCFFF